MAQMGINLLIAESKNELVQFINKQIKGGVPISVVVNNIELIMPALHEECVKVVEKEKKIFNEELQKEIDKQNDNFNKE